MLVFPAIGLLLWVAFLFVVMVLAGVVWAASRLALALASFLQRPVQGPVAAGLRTPPQVPHPLPRHHLPRPGPPPALLPNRDRTPPPVHTTSQARAQADIWPKWTPAHRRYVDEELALWQEQFDALSSRR
jgi:hypothetical protein